MHAAFKPMHGAADMYTSTAGQSERFRCMQLLGTCMLHAAPCMLLPTGALVQLASSSVHQVPKQRPALFDGVLTCMRAAMCTPHHPPPTHICPQVSWLCSAATPSAAKNSAKSSVSRMMTLSGASCAYRWYHAAVVGACAHACARRVASLHVGPDRAQGASTKVPRDIGSIASGAQAGSPA